MAFRELVRLVGTSYRIPLVHNRNSPRHKKKFEKINWLAIQIFSTRSGDEVCDTHILEWSGRATIFNQDAL